MVDGRKQKVIWALSALRLRRRAGGRKSKGKCGIGGKLEWPSR